MGDRKVYVTITCDVILRVDDGDVVEDIIRDGEFKIHRDAAADVVDCQITNINITDSK